MISYRRRREVPSRLTAKVRLGNAPLFFARRNPPNWLRKTPDAKSKCDCMHALAGGILTVSPLNRRSTSIPRAASPANSSNRRSDELAGLGARGFGTLADVSTTPTIQIASHPHCFGTALTTTGGPQRVAWATAGGRKHGVSRGFVVTLLGLTAAAWARMGG